MSIDTKLARLEDKNEKKESEMKSNLDSSMSEWVDLNNLIIQGKYEPLEKFLITHPYINIEKGQGARSNPVLQYANAEDAEGLKCIQLLIDYRANVNATCYPNEPVLFHRVKNMEMVRLLIQNKADFDQFDSSKRNIHQYIRHEIHFAYYLSRLEIIDSDIIKTFNDYKKTETYICLLLKCRQRQVEQYLNKNLVVNVIGIVTSYLISPDKPNDPIIKTDHCTSNLQTSHAYRQLETLHCNSISELVNKDLVTTNDAFLELFPVQDTKLKTKRSRHNKQYKGEYQHGR